jgi:hypothetical protein
MVERLTPSLSASCLVEHAVHVVLDGAGFATLLAELEREGIPARSSALAPETGYTIELPARLNACTSRTVDVMACT